jgi:hypothetical protein
VELILPVIPEGNCNLAKPQPINGRAHKRQSPYILKAGYDLFFVDSFWEGRRQETGF